MGLSKIAKMELILSGSKKEEILFKNTKAKCNFGFHFL